MKKNCKSIGITAGAVLCLIEPASVRSGVSVLTGDPIFTPIITWFVCIGGGLFLGWLAGIIISALSKRHDPSA